MDLFTNAVTHTSPDELPSRGWLTAIGIFLLIGSVLQDLIGISIINAGDLLAKSADLLSIYFIPYL